MSGAESQDCIAFPLKRRTRLNGAPAILWATLLVYLFPNYVFLMKLAARKSSHALGYGPTRFISASMRQLDHSNRAIWEASERLFAFRMEFKTDRI